MILGEGKSTGCQYTKPVARSSNSRDATENSSLDSWGVASKQGSLGNGEVWSHVAASAISASGRGAWERFEISPLNPGTRAQKRMKRISGPMSRRAGASESKNALF